MLASELIKKIQAEIDEKGDGKVVIINEAEEALYLVKDVYADEVNQEKQIVIEVA